MVRPRIDPDRTVHQRHGFATSALGDEPRSSARHGFFRVTVHSDVSGRSLALAVDAGGVGHDVAYVNEDPRQLFLVIESANLQWTLAADDGVAATVAPRWTICRLCIANSKLLWRSAIHARESAFPPPLRSRCSRQESPDREARTEERYVGQSHPRIGVIAGSELVVTSDEYGAGRSGALTAESQTVAGR
jgi:hypothetical protein